MSERDQPQEKAAEQPESAEGPKRGSDEMRGLVHEAEHKADKNVTEKAPEEQDRQLREGTENAS